MKYHSHILNEKQKINHQLKELEERILILKRSIESDRRNAKVGKKTRKRRPVSMPSFSTTIKSTTRTYVPQYNQSDRKILDNLSSGYNTKVPKSNDNYQRNKALIMAGITLLALIWIIYSLTH